MRGILEACGWAVLHGAWLGVLLHAAWLLLLRNVRAAEVRYRFGGALLLVFSAAFCGVAVLFLVAKTGTLTPSRVPAGLAGLVLTGSLPPAVQRAAEPATWPPTLRVVGMLWLAGAALCLARVAGGWHLAKRLYLRDARPARAGWRAAVARMAAQWGVGAPPVLESPRAGSPALFGFFRPVLVLPSRGMQALDRAEFEAVIAHELAHLRRRDPLHSLVQCAAEALLFFHPLVWRVSAALREEREKLCDAAASAHGPDAATYVRGLLGLERLRAGGTYALAARAGGALADRVRYLLEPRAARRPAAVAALSAGLAVAVALGAAALLPPALAAAARSAGPDRFTVRAVDDAGPFALTFRYGRVVAASVGGVELPPSRYVQRADSVVFLDANGGRQFAVFVRPSGGIRWNSRRASTP